MLTGSTKPCPNRSPWAGKEHYDEGISDVQKLFFQKCHFYLRKNIALNTHLRCRRAGFSLQPPMILEGYTEEGPISSPVEG